MLIFLVSLGLTTSIFVSDKVYCDSYDCPDYYKLVDNADAVSYTHMKLPKDESGKKGEASPKHTLREGDDDARCHKLEQKNCILLAILQGLSGMRLKMYSVFYFQPEIRMVLILIIADIPCFIASNDVDVCFRQSLLRLILLP